MQNSLCKQALSGVWGRLNSSLIVRGEGSYIFDDQGNRYLDFTSGIGVTATGHCHPQIVGAIQSPGESAAVWAVELHVARNHASLCDGASRSDSFASIETFFFANSGAEAVEGAVKLARIATGRPNVIAFEGGFHGRTAMTMALTSSKKVFREGFPAAAGGCLFFPISQFVLLWLVSGRNKFVFVLSNLSDCCKLSPLRTRPPRFIIEPVLGEGGFVPAPAEFLSGLREICDRTGILFIVDEIQSGFGRTLVKCGHTSTSGIRPDILTMAKGIASGLPMSAIGASHELMSRWVPGSHGGTFGGWIRNFNGRSVSDAGGN